MTLNAKAITKAGSTDAPNYASVPYNEPEFVVTAEPIPASTISEPSAPPRDDFVSPPSEVPRRAKKSNTFNLTLCGDVRFRAPRIRPGFNTFLTVCGNHTFDLTESQLPIGTTITFFVLKVCGDVMVVAPPGVTVESHGITLCGDREIEMGSASSHSDPVGPAVAAPHVRIWFIAPLCGSLRVTQSGEEG
eukprot:CAMPEP_0197442524 /NCGR_PEP_ID=MMETSP1175-20131217/8521_1 /TAXON_ID=1003142 /ORGANISM="Triceratium dubium, Strain CCMP147" /LENGTH=189 /DNA_ID=CAMNT_0042973017 /DNA_START=60 /DNA_END=629 /DNA_ORIENTATION=+